MILRKKTFTLKCPEVEATGKRKSGSFNSDDLVLDLLDEAVSKFPKDSNIINVIDLYDDLEVSLLDDISAQNAIKYCFNDPDFDQLSSIEVRGNVNVPNSKPIVFENPNFNPAQL